MYQFQQYVLVNMQSTAVIRSAQALFLSRAESEAYRKSVLYAS
jgi:hypothetical protein